VVAQFRLEAQYKAMPSLTYKLVLIKQVFQELKFCEIHQMKLFSDNQIAHHVISNFVSQEKIKHREIDCHFV